MPGTRTGWLGVWDCSSGALPGSTRQAVAARPSGKSIRVGRLYLPGASPEIDRAVDRALLAAGFEVVTLGEAFREAWKQAEKDGNTVAATGIWLQNREIEDQPEVSARAKATFLLGKNGYPDDYRKALRNKAAWQRTLRRVFGEVDFIALPTLQNPPPSITLLGNTLLLEAAVLAIQNTMPVNFAGNPALAIPVPLETGAAAAGEGRPAGQPPTRRPKALRGRTPERRPAHRGGRAVRPGIRVSGVNTIAERSDGISSRERKPECRNTLDEHAESTQNPAK